MYAEPAQQWVIALQLLPGATVLDAIVASGILQQCPQLDLQRNRAGVYGQLVTLDTPLQAGDRVELYRPLPADPRELRRQRARTGGKRR